MIEFADEQIDLSGVQTNLISVYLCLVWKPLIGLSFLPTGSKQKETSPPATHPALVKPYLRHSIEGTIVSFYGSVTIPFVSPQTFTCTNRPRRTASATTTTPLLFPRFHIPPHTTSHYTNLHTIHIHFCALFPAPKHPTSRTQFIPRDGEANTETPNHQPRNTVEMSTSAIFMTHPYLRSKLIIK